MLGCAHLITKKTSPEQAINFKIRGGLYRTGHKAVHPEDPQWNFSDGVQDSYGTCLPPYENALGEREPSTWARRPEPNFYSFGGWCP